MRNFRLFLLAFLGIVALSIVQSCNKIENETSNPKSEIRTDEGIRFTQTSLSNSSLLPLVQTWLNNKGILSQINVNASKVTTDTQLGKTNIVLSFFVSQPNEKQIILLVENGVIDRGIKFQAIIENNVTKLNYYNFIDELIYTTENLNGTTTTTTVVWAKGGKGQYTADCIDEWYSGKGWTSVALFTATLFDPGIGVAVAAGCGLSSLFCSC